MILITLKLPIVSGRFPRALSQMTEHNGWDIQQFFFEEKEKIEI